jgi:endonuclease/exonuclease/phosphatase family metal-dependent hydrolase
MKLEPEIFKVITYNIHRCRGTDGRYDPHRIANFLSEANADIIGLQEVDTGLMVPLCERRHKHQIPYVAGLAPGMDACEGLHQLEYITAKTAYKPVTGLMSRGHGEFGNVILTPHPVKEIRRIDLTLRGSWERRGALDVDIEVRGHPVRVIVAHLGLEILERYFQVSRLLKALGDDRKQQVVMMGDFNLLASFLPKFRRLYRRLGHTPILRTFPARFPLLPLDRIWSQPASALLKVERIETPITRVASDHLPLAATIQVAH